MTWQAKADCIAHMRKIVGLAEVIFHPMKFRYSAIILQH